MRRTKIVCTIGPASSGRRMIERMMRAGMDVARVNFSHGSHEQHAAVIADLREVSRRLGRPLAILQDLSGPKVRLGDFAAPSIHLKRGDVVAFAPLDESDIPPNGGNCRVLPLPVPELLAALRPGNMLLLDDGKIALKVTRSDGEPLTADRLVWARCQVGGELKPHKGVTAPGVSFDVPAVTEKDLVDLRFGIEQGVDWVAASYIRTAADMDPLRAVLRATGCRAALLAKIEKSEAVSNLDAILRVVDGMMVARGDLGVEMPFDKVPLVQKRIVKRCNAAGKPVITATQMLESMISCPRPTRAEAADVANAILDGTDAVMLSGETAVGAYPLEAVRTMARVAARTEEGWFKETGFDHLGIAKNDITEVVARATAEMACELNARLILCATSSGGTARMVAKYRPRVPILAVTTDADTYRKLTLTWGVVPSLIDAVADTDEMIRATIAAAERARLVKTGDRVVLTAGVPVNNSGATNLIKVHMIGQPI